MVPWDKADHKRFTSSFSPPAAPCPRGRLGGLVPLVLVTLSRCCVAAAVVATAVAAVSSGGGGDGGGAGFFPGGVAFDDFLNFLSLSALGLTVQNLQVQLVQGW